VLILLLDYLTSGGTRFGTGALGTVILGTSLDAPVEDVVVLVAFANEEITEELAQVRIVRLVVEAKSASVVEEYSKLVGETSAEEVGRRSHLLFHDTIVFLLLGGSLEALPWESTAEEIHEDVCEGFKVITTSLFDAQVGVDRSVASGTSQVLVLAVRDVQVGLWVAEFLCETKVNNVDLVATFANAHQEVVGLDVTMNEVARVDILNARDQLVSEQEHSLEAELAVAEVEQVLKGRAEQVKHHGVVVALCAEPPDEWNADTASEGLVNL